MLIVSLFAAFVPARVVGEMTSIGTLFAFILVCIGVLIMRNKMPEAPRAFRTPFVPFVPLAGVFVCLFMMVFLPLDTWIRLIVWMMIGFDLYLFYGMKNSILNVGNFSLNNYKTVAGSGLVMVLALIIIAFIHHNDPAIDDHFLFYFSLAAMTTASMYTCRGAKVSLPSDARSSVQGPAGPTRRSTKRCSAIPPIRIAGRNNT